eukprot:TRINITY_DN5770_c0_g1_i1.p1 TRINITY_DN5770_c0_g1~~TRINITY_DN5770_c0_g1_i1.p1  ORF type:complete len:506 (-),score=69.70 TRINITY_DN5770_c0_g1_i1:203-1654(-)
MDAGNKHGQKRKGIHDVTAPINHPPKKRRSDNDQIGYNSFDSRSSSHVPPLHAGLFNTISGESIDAEQVLDENGDSNDLAMLSNTIMHQQTELHNLRSTITKLAEYAELVGTAVGVRVNDLHQFSPQWANSTQSNKTMAFPGGGYPRIVWQKKAAIKLVKDLYLRQSRSGNGVEQFLRKFFLLRGEDVDSPKMWKRTLAKMKTNFRKEKQYFVERLRKYFTANHDVLKNKVMEKEEAQKFVALTLASWEEAANMNWQFVHIDKRDVDTIWDRKDPTIGMHLVVSAILGCCVHNPSILKTKGPSSPFFKILKQLDVITLREQIKHDLIRRVFEECGFSMNSPPGLDTLVNIPNQSPKRGLDSTHSTDSPSFSSIASQNPASPTNTQPSQQNSITTNEGFSANLSAAEFRREALKFPPPQLTQGNGNDPQARGAYDNNNVVQYPPGETARYPGQPRTTYSQPPPLTLTTQRPMSLPPSQQTGIMQ